MEWFNPPPAWNESGSTITVQAGRQTDFWRKTHYGFVRDNGHFLFEHVAGDFVAEVKVSGAYTAQYDQTGLMVRVDEANWLKCGIEFVDGQQHVSAVVTRDYSDWSVVPLRPSPAALWLRLIAQGTSIEVHYSFDGTAYQLLRVTYLPLASGAQVGVMCAAPDGAGFPATFEGFSLRRQPAAGSGSPGH